MKKLYVFLIILFQINTFTVSSQQVNNIHFCNAQEQSNYGYYKCSSSCLFFKTSDITNMDISNIYFTIPEGYFVKKISDISATTIKVTYMNKIGYVMTERVRLVSFLPNVKVLENITFDISNFSGTQLWSSPSTETPSNMLVRLIPAGTKNLTYIASTRGEIPAGTTSSVWYYCYYSPDDDPTSVFEGYIHSGKTTNLSQIPTNLEDDIINKPTESIQNTSPIRLSNAIEIILIVLISIPLLVIIVLLILSSKRKEKINNIENSNISNDQNQVYDPPIIRDKSSLNNIDKIKNKKFSIKKSIENFMFDEIQAPNHNSQKIAFDTLDFDDEDDLL